MIQRQGRHHQLLALLEFGLDPRMRLRQIGQNVSVRQHRALGDPRRSAGVLQISQIAQPHRYRRKSACRALRQRRAKIDGPRNTPRRNHFLDVLDDKINQRPLGKAQQIAHPHDHHVLHRGTVNHLRQRVRKILQNNNGFRAGVLELMFQLTRRIKRIAINHHATGTQRTEHAHGILQDIRHHQRHAVALLQLEHCLQIRRKVTGQGIEFAVGQLRPHVDESHAIAIMRHAVLEHRPDRLKLAQINFGRNPFLIALQPNPVHAFLL